MNDTITLLELERAHPTFTPAKWAALADLGLTQAIYLQRLIRCLDTPEAIKHDAALVRHLRTRLTTAVNRRAALIGRKH